MEIESGKEAQEQVPGDFDPIPHNHFDCERVAINISGERYETQLRTLFRYPNTLLGDKNKMLRYYDPDKNEYFFDRNRPSFDAILYYYQSGGTLLRPSDVPLDIFLEELKFYQLDKDVVEAFKIEEGWMKEEDELLPKNVFQKEVWLLLEHPETSKQAQIFAVFSVFVICFSIFLFCLETVLNFNRYTLFQIDDNVTSVEEDEIPDFGNPFFVIESMCIAWFTLELFLRFGACPDKMAFVTDIMNAVDVIAILPYFLTLYTVLTEDENAIVTSKLEGDEGFSVANLKVTRLARVFRIFKLSRHSKGLRIILMTFQASMNEIRLLVMLLSILSVLFSSFVYFAEANDANSFFKSIPDAFWWSIVTMTTVGYGDVTPIGFWGKVVGVTCVMSGLLTLVLPSPFIETNFMYYYTREANQWQFHTENYDHIESCPFLPGHSTIKQNLEDSVSKSDSQLSLHQLIEKVNLKKKEQLLESDEINYEMSQKEEASNESETAADSAENQTDEVNNKNDTVEEKENPQQVPEENKHEIAFPSTDDLGEGESEGDERPAEEEKDENVAEENENECHETWWNNE